MPFAKPETAFVEHFSEHWATMGNGSRAVRRLKSVQRTGLWRHGCPRHLQAVTKDGTFVVCRLKSLDACAGHACPEASIGVAVAAAGLPAPGEP